MRPAISVIVLVYNVEDYFRECLQSLFEQTLLNIEYIFVDDATLDKSMLILDEMILKYPNRRQNIKIIHHETNRGVSTARNSGLEAATGKYIIFCDGDDWIDKSMYEVMYSEAMKKKADIVWCDYILFSEKKEIIEKQQPLGISKREIISSLLGGYIHGGNCNKLVLSSLYNIRFPDGYNMLEDLVVTIQLFNNSTNICYLPIPLYHYRQNEKSLSRNTEDMSVVYGRIQSQIHNARSIISYLKNSNIYDDCIPELYYFQIHSKNGLLADRSLFNEWRATFPEANSYILSCPKLTFKSKILQWLLVHRIYWLYDIKQKMKL